MGLICFEGDPPYELMLSTRAQAKSEGEIVRLTLPVLVPGPERQEREIQVLLRFGHARALGVELRDAAIEAKKRARGGASD